MANITFTTTLIHNIHDKNGKVIMSYPDSTLLDLILKELWSDIIRYYYRSPIFAIGQSAGRHEGYKLVSHKKMNKKFMDHLIIWYRELGGLVSLENFYRRSYVLCKSNYTLMFDGVNIITTRNINKDNIVLLKTEITNTKYIFDNLEKINTTRILQMQTRYGDIGHIMGLFVSTEFYDYVAI